MGVKPAECAQSHVIVGVCAHSREAKLVQLTIWLPCLATV